MILESLTRSLFFSLAIWAVIDSGGGRAVAAELRCGAAKVDVSPQEFPVIKNGGFLEALIERAIDPLHARALVFDDGSVQAAIVIVDSCMIPRDLCDEAKSLALKATGIPVERILISATHTHSAPSVMDFCLGSRKDPAYTAFLPGKIAEAIQLAHSRLQPAKVGFAIADGSKFTSNRRWIRRSDQLETDPFGERTVQAMMHPGYGNPDYIGPSGPIDPDLSLLSVRSLDDRPIALLANFSMHYFAGHQGSSADYYGRFAKEMQRRLGRDESEFVGIMSQGTSGDLWWGDYSLTERQKWTIDEYTESLASVAEKALEGIEYKGDLDLAMNESRITLERRVPDTQRLEWATEKLKEMGEHRPRNRPEVYAEQAKWIDANRSEEIVLQVLRIGDLAITGIPNEVYAITGLKLKERSPFAKTFNISLANGAAGYIPPPEQHALGGYTTWPARTAGLETEAEPKIVDQLIKMMMQLADSSGNRAPELQEPVHDTSLAGDLIFYMDMGDLGFVESDLRSVLGFRPLYSGNLAFAVPGISRSGLKRSSAIHFAGGKMESGNSDQVIERWSRQFEQGDTTLEMWFWNGIPGETRDISGYLYSHGNHALGISGTASTAPNRLFFANELGRTDIIPRSWNHVMLTCDRKGNVRLYLNGNKEPEISTREKLAGISDFPLRIAADRDDTANFEGRIDEVSVFKRVFSAEEVADRFQSFGMEVPTAPEWGSFSPSENTGSSQSVELEDDPRSPEETIALTHVSEGFVLELVAAEPLVADPVAIDWGADGKLWVVEMADYPYGMDGKGKPGGRVRYLEDVDKDGTYDQSTIFVDGLRFPTSVMAWKNGVLITAAPDLLFASDPDGDGQAEVTVIFSGFVQGNQQLRVNSLRWGLDNWIYCASGGHHVGFGKDTVIVNARGDSVSLGSRDFRFNPDSGILDPQSGPSQFGRVRDDYGNWFGVQNSWPLWHYVLHDHYLRRNSAFAAPDPRVQVRKPGNPPVYPNKPIQKRFHSYEQAGRYTSACGPSIYRDSLLFRSDQMTGFTCEPFHNLVQRHEIRRDGVSFKGERAADGGLDFFASSDRWCRPVMSRTGPDGALYIVDMYRYMIEHPDWLPPNGRKALEAFYRSGEDKGRIYRIRKKDQPLRKLTFAKGDGADHWLNMLESENGIVRDLAHRTLMEVDLTGEESKVLTSLAMFHQSAKTRIHSLSILAGKGAMSMELLKSAAAGRSPELRVHAARIAEALAADESEAIESLVQLSQDPAPTVRLQAILSLGNVEGKAAGEALVAAAKASSEAQVEPYLRAAVMSSAPRHLNALTEGIDSLPLPLYSKPLFALSWGNSAMIPLLNAMKVESTRGFEIASDYFETEDQRGSATKIAEADIRPRLQQLISSIVPQVAMRAMKAVSDRSLSLVQRQAAIQLIGRMPESLSRGIELLGQILNDSAENEILRLAAMNRLFAIEGNDFKRSILSGYDSLSPRLRVAVIEQSLLRSASTLALLDSIATGSIPKISIPLTIQQQLLNSDNASVRELAEGCFSSAQSPDLVETIAQRTAEIDRLKDTGTGSDTFQQRCAVCHNVEDGASRLGPDLRSITDRSVNGLLTAIIDPDRSVDPGYAGVTATLKNGETYYGRVFSETGASYRLMSVDGSVKGVSRDVLQEIKLTPKSLMPEGLIGDLSSQQLADLVSYLSGLGKAEQN